MKPQLFEIIILESAEKDLFEIYDYLEAECGGAFAANFVVEIKSAIETLSQFPERGRAMEELSRLGFSGYRRIIFQTYLIIFRILDDKVIVTLIADGRRDMQSLLERRILR